MTSASFRVGSGVLIGNGRGVNVLLYYRGVEFTEVPLCIEIEGSCTERPDANAKYETSWFSSGSRLRWRFKKEPLQGHRSGSILFLLILAHSMRIKSPLPSLPARILGI